MAVKLRLRRMGRKKLPVFSLVATDGRSPRDGRYIEDLGRYEPLSEPAMVDFNQDRVLYWLQEGAQPSYTVRNLLSDEGIMLRLHMLRKGKEEEEIEQAVSEFLAHRASKVATKKSKAEIREERLAAERAAAEEKAKEIAAAKAAREAELEAQRQEAEAEERAARQAEEEGGDDAEAATEEAAEQVEESAPEAEAAEVESEKSAEEAPAEQPEVETEASEEAAEEPTEEPEAEAAEETPDTSSKEAQETPAEGEEKAEEAREAIAAAEEVDPERVEETEAAAAEMVEEGAPVDTEAAEEPAAEASTEPDDLTKVRGIGPKFSELLNQNDITTYDQLAKLELEALRAIVNESGISASQANEESWAKQAEFLAAGDKEGLKTYIEELKSA